MSVENGSAAPDPAGEGSGSAPDGAARPEDHNGGAGEQTRKIVALRPLADDALDRACARFPMTDLGNAERFIHRHGQDFRFCAELGWFRWDGRRWQLLGEEPKQLPPEVMQALFSTMRAIKNEAQLVRGSGERAEAPPGLAGEALAEALLPVVMDGRSKAKAVTAGADAPRRAASALAWHDAGGV